MSKLSFDAFDESIRPVPEQTGFDHVLEQAISRRGFLGAGVQFGLAAFGAGVLHNTVNAESPPPLRFDPLPFASIGTNTLDTVSLPPGYHWQVVVGWGQALMDGGEFNWSTCGDAAAQAKAFGDNNDGMSLFQHRGHTLLAVNNEYTNLDISFAYQGGKPISDDNVLKEMRAHGVSVVEIEQSADGQWRAIKNSPFNRRITPQTDMELTGPAAGSALLKTSADSTGRSSKGTWNNCGNGRTPWGTYLTCEENFNGYFSSSDASYQPTLAMQRYGVSDKDWGYHWAQIDQRFDISKEPNECNRCGYVVEIDPTQPTSTPKKHTALGRLKHENAELVVADNGHIVVYMGDDERGEFLYRFVSKDVYSPQGEHDNLLESGQLYVAKFNPDNTGRWLALTPEATGMTAAEIAVYTRMAASKVGATTMDRPEWVAANPHTTELYCALTNNKNRGLKPNAGGDETPVMGPNPRAKNIYGQILRWRPDQGDHTSEGFSWDLFVMAGNPSVHQDAYAGSANVDVSNMFNSPDGLSFSPNGLWIQTDGNYSNQGEFAGHGNNQMLLADPVSGRIRRFLVGPRECEVTGMTWSPDGRTMFIGIQHPGENGDSHFPGGVTNVPRSCVVAIQRDDGQPFS